MLLHNPFGPIFEKELRATSRRKRSYVLRVVYLGGLLLFLVLAYLASEVNSPAAQQSVAQRVQRQNMLGQIFFVCFTIFSTGAMAMIGAVLTSTAISSERLHKSLHVLLMTPISAWQIVTGKLFSRLLVALTLIGLSLPVVALVRLLGGVELEQMFAAIALCTATAVVSAAFGLLFSTFVSRAYAVILFAYGLMLLLWVGVPILILAPHFDGPAPPFGAIRVISTISPFFSAAFISVPVGAMFTANWHWCAALQLGIAAACVATSALALRRIQRREGSIRVDDAPAMPELVGDRAVDNKDKPRAKRPPRRRRDVGNNPVLWREIGRPLFNRRWQSIAGLVLFVVLLAASYFVMWKGGALDDKELQVAYSWMFNAVLWLVLSVLAGTAITQEKESNTWTLLLATPLSGSRIVLGKILGLYQRMIWPMMLVVAHFSLFAVDLFGRGAVISWVVVGLIVWIILSFNAVWVATGVLLSLLIRRITTAVILNMMLGIGLYVFVPVLVAITWMALEWHDEGWMLIWWTSPYTYLVTAVDSLSPDFDALRSVWLPGDINVKAPTFVMIVFAAGLVHLVVAGGIVAITVACFNRIVGRSPQLVPLPPDEPRTGLGGTLTGPAPAI